MIHSLKNYIEGIKTAYNTGLIESLIKQFKTKKLLVIGDTIIDEYYFTSIKGTAIKDPIISAEYKYHETYPGGILAIYSHLSDFADKINLVTLLGEYSPNLDFIKKNIHKNTNFKHFIKPDSHTIVKRRYIDAYRNNKLFKIEYMNDMPISEKLSGEILDYLRNEIKKYDIVIAGDFGHGFLNKQIRECLDEESPYLSINVQTNSANRGYNYVNLYKKPDFFTINEEELRLTMMKRFDDTNEVIRELHNTFKYGKFLVTRGKEGCTFFNDGNIVEAPALTENVIDTIGSGDAVFSIASLFVHSHPDDNLVPFIANCAGAIKSNYMGNKERITAEKLLRFIKELYENELE